MKPPIDKEEEITLSQAETARHLRGLSKHLDNQLCGRGGTKWKPGSREEWMEQANLLIEVAKTLYKMPSDPKPANKPGRPKQKPESPAEDPAAKPGTRSFPVGQPAGPSQV